MADKGHSTGVGHLGGRSGGNPVVSPTGAAQIGVVTNGVVSGGNPVTVVGSNGSSGSGSGGSSGSSSGSGGAKK